MSTASLFNLRNFVTSENPEDYLPKLALEIDISPLVKSFTDEVKIDQNFIPDVLSSQSGILPLLKNPGRHYGHWSFF